MDQDPKQGDVATSQQTAPAAQPLTGFLPLLPTVLPWYPAVAVVIYLKLKLIGMAEYTEQAQALIATRAADRSPTGVVSTLATYLDQLSFFRADLFLSMIAIPACLLVAARFLPTRLSSWLPAALATFVTVVFYIQRQALVNTGVFIGWNSILDAADWALMRPDDISLYLNPGGMIRTGLVLLTIALLAFAARRFRSSASLLPSSLAKRFASLAIAIIALPTLAAWLPATPKTWLHTSGFSRVLGSFFETHPADYANPAGDDLLELERRYQALTLAAEPPKNSTYRGSAAGYNLVVVALETAPARVLDFDGSLENLPNLARLKEHAWVATNHYSTFPNSAPALFSLMSSFYGGDPRRLFSKLDSVAPSTYLRKL